jgi:16S rRNA (cytosine1402-N4)-methyltransferase
LNAAGEVRTISHIPVLLDKVIEYMDPKPGKNYIDATGGPGSMSAALLARTSPDGRVLTLDCDPRAQEEELENLGGFGIRSVRRRVNFSRIAEVAREDGFERVGGILFDLGISSRMVDSPEYGASIRHDSTLDMRMDPDLDVTAHDLVNSLSEDELTELFHGMDEHRWARRIAKAIVRARKEAAIETTGQLADLVAGAIPAKFHPRRIHPATRVFLALRVAVNRERESLEIALRACPDLMATGSVLIVICYSSFEDQTVRRVIREARDRWEHVTKKAICPDEGEIERNPRSRSARLRAYRKAA